MSGYWVPKLEGHPLAVWEMYASYFYESAEDNDAIHFQDRLKEMRKQSALVLQRGGAKQHGKKFLPPSFYTRCA